MRKSVLILLLVSLIILVSCTPALESTSEAPPEVMHLKIGIAPFLSFAPLFIAQEEGYFEQAGLEVEFINLPRSADLLPAISQGNIDVGGVIVATSTINLIAQGENIRYVAERGSLNADDCTYYAMVARPDLLDSNTADLAGRRVATDQASFHEFFVDQVIASGGLTPESVIKESSAMPAIPDLLASDQVDYATANEPWLIRMQSAEQADVWKSGQDILPDFQFLYYVFGPSILDDNRDLGRRFMQAYLLAKAQYEEGKTDRNVEIIMQYTDLDEELVRDACWISLRDDLSIDEESLMHYQEWSVERGYSDEILDIAELIDTSFIEEATSDLD